MTSDAAVRYERTDLETLALPAAAFDVAYSSLVLHYLEDLDRVLAMVRRALRSGGAFVFSMEHPIYTAPLHPSWIEGAGTDWVWPLHAYAEEGPRRTDWLAKDVLKYHRTSGSVLNALIRNDFVIDAVHDFCPSVADIEAYPDWRRDRQRPIFLLIGTHSGGT
jgi:SAM-dependent methyltransferase